MKIIAQLASYLILVGLIVPSFLFFWGKMDLGQVKHWMLIATIGWFVVTPLWMGRKSSAE